VPVLFADHCLSQTGCGRTGTDASEDGDRVVPQSASRPAASRSKVASILVGVCGAFAVTLALRLMWRAGSCACPAPKRDRGRGVPHVQEPPAGRTACGAQRPGWGLRPSYRTQGRGTQVIRARRQQLRQGSVGPRLVVGAMGERAAGAVACPAVARRRAG
jgi:hypothetical protein